MISKLIDVENCTTTFKLREDASVFDLAQSNWLGLFSGCGRRTFNVTSERESIAVRGDYEENWREIMYALMLRNGNVHYKCYLKFLCVSEKTYNILY